METIYKDRTVKALFSALDSLNLQLARDEKLQKSTETILTGKMSKLDSLGLINFILAVEQKIEDEFQKTITLTEDEDLISSPNGPLQTIGTLADYIAYQLARGL